MKTVANLEKVKNNSEAAFSEVKSAIDQVYALPIEVKSILSQTTPLISEKKDAIKQANPLP